MIMYVVVISVIVIASHCCNKVFDVKYFGVLYNLYLEIFGLKNRN